MLNVALFALFDIDPNILTIHMSLSHYISCLFVIFLCFHYLINLRYFGDLITYKCLFIL